MSERNVRLSNKKRETYADGAAVRGSVGRVRGILGVFGVFCELAFGTYLFSR